MDEAVRSVANTRMVTARNSDSADVISRYFSDRVRFVPLLDARGRLVAVARPGIPGIKINGRSIGPNDPSYLIAEIGINHNGSLENAKSLVDAAVKAGADCAKFQMRQMSALYRNAGAADDPREDLGAQYTLDVLSRSALDNQSMIEVFEYCHEKGIQPLCTPWEEESLRVLEDYGMAAYKVASADLTNHSLLRALIETGKPLILSTGMSREQEIIEAVTLLQENGAAYVLLHCNSTYPAPLKDVNLRYLKRLQQLGGSVVGYSGHERGWAVPIAAVAMGAKVIEKHFTLDKTLPGNDHKVSLLPQEFQDMVQAIRSIEEAMGSDDTREPSQGERMNRETLAKSLMARVEIKAGDELHVGLIDVKSPGTGLQPNRLPELFGLKAKRDFQPGDFFFTSDLDEAEITDYAFQFRRPWGLPVRYHDWERLYGLSKGIDFLEFHFSFKDLERDPTEFFSGPVDCGLVTHSPDLFNGDHLLNLADPDPDYRKRSLMELQNAIDVTRRLRDFFKTDADTFIIASLGGFSKNAPLPVQARPELYDRVMTGLSQLNLDEVELLPQTLPPYPWYFGGQLFCNLFVDPEDTAQFSKDSGFRLCFDVSHSKLACNHRKISFADFTDIIAPHTAHLHIVDAAGVDGEGLQISEGEIDFAMLARQVDKHCPEASFIPEIWQGHKNDGEGFWIALSRLREWF